MPGDVQADGSDCRFTGKQQNLNDACWAAALLRSGSPAPAPALTPDGKAVEWMEIETFHTFIF